MFNLFKNKEIFMDHASSTPIDGGAMRAMKPFLQERFHNPRALYRRALDIARSLDRFRLDAANHFAVAAKEIIFTAGASEANALALVGTALYHRAHSNTIPKILISAVEHSSIRKVADFLTTQKLADIDVIPVSRDGVVDPRDVYRRLDDSVKLISVMYANNETGIIQPIREIAKSVRRFRREHNSPTPYIHTDATQAVNFLDINCDRLGVDLLSACGTKIYGPKMSGLLVKHDGVPLAPLIHGGGQENGMRAGTESVAQIAGLVSALNKTRRLSIRESERMANLQQYFFEQIQKHFPKIIITNLRKETLPNIVHLLIPGVDSDEYILRFDSAGVLVGGGSACAARDEGSSHVINAMFGDDFNNYAALRFSMGRGTSRSDIDATIRVMRQINRFFD